MFDGWTQQEKDILAIVGLLAGFGLGGAFSIGAIFTVFQKWMIVHGVLLQGTNVPIVFPWSPGIGLDLPRLIIVVGIFLAILLAAAFLGAKIRSRNSALRA